MPVLQEMDLHITVNKRHMNICPISLVFKLWLIKKMFNGLASWLNTH